MLDFGFRYATKSKKEEKKKQQCILGKKKVGRSNPNEKENNKSKGRINPLFGYAAEIAQTQYSARGSRPSLLAHRPVEEVAPQPV